MRAEHPKSRSATLRRYAAPLLLIGAVSQLGCEASYLARQGFGQMQFLLASQPTSRLIRDPQQGDQAWRWALAWRAREFARTHMHLDVDTQYTRAVELDRDAAVYVVSAAQAFSLKPYTWWFPLVGEVPYKGFFSRADAEQEQRRLQAEGYDVLLRPVPTYSLLGYLPDPLLSTMLSRSPERIVETVIHELAHATIYVAGRPQFNEGLATFIGRQGRQDFIATYLGANSSALKQAQLRDEDAGTYREVVAALGQDLASYYARGGRDPRVKARIFARHQRAYVDKAWDLNTVAYRAAQLPHNNAEVAALRVYVADHQLYAQAFAMQKGDWRQFVDLLRGASNFERPRWVLQRSVQRHLAQRLGSLNLAE